MNTKELIAACRDMADTLGDANLRISTTKFDSRSVSDLLWAAAAALEAKCSCGKAGAECSGDRKQTNGDWFRSLTDEQLLDSPFRGALCDMAPSCQTGGHIACGDCLRGFLAAEHEG